MSQRLPGAPWSCPVGAGGVFYRPALTGAGIVIYGVDATSTGTEWTTSFEQ
jgi:hypothetical protein